MANNSSIQLLRGNDLNTKSNILLEGQPAFDIKNNKLYVGDGTTTLNKLSVVNSGEDNKNFYNLGAFDTYVSNGDGTGTITRNTQFYKFTGSEPCSINGYSTACVFILSELHLPKGLEPNTNIISNILQSTPSYDNGIYNGSAQLGISFGAAGYSDRIAIRVADIPQTVEAYREWLGKNNVVIQYKMDRKYCYQVKVIENQPIRPANQEECLFWHEEWRKGLNLYKGESILANQFNTLFEEGELPVGTYTIIISTASGEYNNQIVGGGLTIDSGVYVTTNSPVTFTTIDTSRIQLWVNIPNDVPKYVMIVEGTHPYPYEPYYGGIVHEKDLNEYLPLTGGILTGNLSMDGVITSGGLIIEPVGNLYNEGLRINSGTGWSTISLGTDIGTTEGADTIKGMIIGRPADADYLVLTGQGYESNDNARVKITNKGKIHAFGGLALNSTTTQAAPGFYLTMDPFSIGGTVHWADKSQVLNDIGAYVKPETGIPKGDLSEEVQTALDKAGSGSTLYQHTLVFSKAGFCNVYFNIISTSSQKLIPYPFTVNDLYNLGIYEKVFAATGVAVNIHKEAFVVNNVYISTNMIVKGYKLTTDSLSGKLNGSTSVTIGYNEEDVVFRTDSIIPIK